jgi:hypothetical protein
MIPPNYLNKSKQTIYYPKMPFRIDGTSHSGGVSNEKAIVRHLNETAATPIHQLFGASADMRMEHRGGTQTKTDAVMIVDGVEKTISIKNHKEGTFDWLNSTSALDRDTYRSIIDQLNGFKESYRTGDKTLAQIRTAISDHLNTVLRQFSSEFIVGLLKNVHEAYSDAVMIHDVAKKELVCFLKEGNLKELQTMENSTYFLKPTPRAKTSAQIWRRCNSTGVETNTDLRIRLVLNNGVTALLGESASNKTSVPCVKLQQDKVKEFILAAHNCVHYHYVPSSSEIQESSEIDTVKEVLPLID